MSNLSQLPLLDEINLDFELYNINNFLYKSFFSNSITEAAIINSYSLFTIAFISLKILLISLHK